MTAYQPFAFQREFTPVAVAPEAAIDHATMSALLAEAEARGREDGEAAALARFRTERDCALLRATEVLRAQLASFDGQIAASDALVTEEAGKLALAAADIIAGHALEGAPATTVNEAIGRALLALRRGMPLDVRVHPDLVVPVETLVAERQAGDRRRLSVHVTGDPTLVPGDAQLRWDRGGAVLDRAERRALVERELSGVA